MLEVKPSIRYIIKIITTVDIYLPAWELQRSTYKRMPVFGDQGPQTLTCPNTTKGPSITPSIEFASLLRSSSVRASNSTSRSHWGSTLRLSSSRCMKVKLAGILQKTVLCRDDPILLFLPLQVFVMPVCLKDIGTSSTSSTQINIGDRKHQNLESPKPRE